MNISSNSTNGLSNPLGFSADRDGFATKLFARLDDDRDGKVTESEFTTAMEKRFGASSTTEGGRQDPAEVFKQMDADEDGSINVDEFKSALEAMRPSGGAGGMPPAGGAPPMGGKPPAGGPPGGVSAEEQAEEVFDEADLNEDGVVSVEELIASLEKTAGTDGEANALDDETRAKIEEFFKQVDTDGDNGISKTELASMFEQLRAQGESAHGAQAPYNPDGTAVSGATTGETLSTYA